MAHRAWTKRKQRLMEKCQALFNATWYILIETGHIEDKRDLEIYRVIYLTSLCEWITEWGQSGTGKNQSQTVLTKRQNSFGQP